MPKNDLTWAEARPMIHQLRQLTKMKAVGAQLLFDGGYVGSVEDGQLVLRGPAMSHEEAGVVIYTAPVGWPVSEARG